MINLAGLAGNAPLYIVHLQRTGAGVSETGAPSGPAGLGGDLPAISALDDSCYYRENGVDYLLSPPLRSRREQDKLWVGIAAGDIDTVATDHCNFSHAQRMTLSGRLQPLPQRLARGRKPDAAAFAHGVLGGRISPSRFSSHQRQPGAPVWPLAAQGNLQPGSDADLVLMDPAVTP